MNVVSLSARARCQSCAVRSSGLCSQISDAAANDLARSVHRRRVAEGQVLFGGAPRPKTFGIIVSGVVKLVQAEPDGRSQIVGLQFPSDFVGRPYLDDANLMAEAATELDLCSFSGRIFDSLAEAHPDIERAVLKRTLADLDTAREWMFMLGRKTAQERVASMLVLFAERMRGIEDDPANTDKIAFEMPLSRTDFAACIGLRLETVSRQITSLKNMGIIATGTTRHMQVKDMAALRQISESCAG